MKCGDLDASAGRGSVYHAQPRYRSTHKRFDVNRAQIQCQEDSYTTGKILTYGSLVACPVSDISCRSTETTEVMRSTLFLQRVHAGVAKTLLAA